MFWFILLIVLLIAGYYSFNPASAKKKFTRSTGSPFQGRFREPPRQTHHTIDKGSMLRCHNCGTFFPEARVQRKVVEGHVLEFCTTNCRDHFRFPNG